MAISTSIEAPVFDWSNFDELAAYLIGEAIEPERFTVTTRGQSTSYQLPKYAGEGRMEYLELASGLLILIFDCCWAQEKVCRVVDGDWIRFNFSLSANMTMQSVDGDRVFAVFPSWRIINNSDTAETIETLFSGERLVWVTICCRPQHLSDLSGVSAEDMPDILQAMLLHSGSGGFHDLFDFTARLNAIAADIIRCSLPDGLRLSYIEARAIELLCYGLDHIMHPRGQATKIVLSAKDRDALTNVREILDANFAAPPSILELSRTAGINRNKLFYGFKMLFGTTISDFVQNLRLDEGHKLLLKTDWPIIEIAEHVGFRHQCNFSTAVKRRFGLSPSQIRKDRHLLDSI